MPPKKLKELKDEDLVILDVNKPKNNFIEVHPYLMPVPSLTLFISPPASGKTLLLVNFIYRFYEGVFDAIYWASPSLNLDNTLDSSIKRDETVVKLSSAEDLENISNIIKYIVEEQKEKLEKGEELEEILIVLDDCLSFVNSRALLVLCSLYRHLRISVFISIQKMKMLNNTIRACASNVITFNIPNRKQREAFLEEYDIFADIEKYYEESTNEKYNWMRLDLRNMAVYHGGPTGIKLVYKK
jgi:hypothetical protein